jgi:hypothetical protein
MVTGTTLNCGLDTVNATKPIIISTLPIAALADNLTDALSIHIFQESRNRGTSPITRTRTLQVCRRMEGRIHLFHMRPR